MRGVLTSGRHMYSEDDDDDFHTTMKTNICHNLFYNQYNQCVSNHKIAFKQLSIMTEYQVSY